MPSEREKEHLRRINISTMHHRFFLKISFKELFLILSLLGLVTDRKFSVLQEEKNLCVSSHQVTTRFSINRQQIPLNKCFDVMVLD